MADRGLARAGPHELLTRARAVRDTVASAQTPLADARDSLALNPRGRRLAADVTALEDDVQRLSAIVTQVIGMTRAFVDDYDDTISSDPEAIAIAEQLRRAAHDVRLGLPATGGAPLEEPPALTRPLEVLTVPRSHWVLIGSLLIDLRRIHSALAASDES